MSKKEKKTSAASSKRRKHGLGLPIHMKMLLIFINIRYYIILVSNRVFYVNYIEFSSGIAICPNEIVTFPSACNKMLCDRRRVMAPCICGEECPPPSVP